MMITTCIDSLSQHLILAVNFKIDKASIDPNFLFFFTIFGIILSFFLRKIQLEISSKQFLFPNIKFLSFLSLNSNDIVEKIKFSNF